VKTATTPEDIELLNAVAMRLGDDAAAFCRLAQRSDLAFRRRLYEMQAAKCQAEAQAIRHLLADASAIQAAAPAPVLPSPLNPLTP
jgi:hypothetical protein